MEGVSVSLALSLVIGQTHNNHFPFYPAVILISRITPSLLLKPLVIRVRRQLDNHITYIYLLSSPSLLRPLPRSTKVRISTFTYTAVWVPYHDQRRYSVVLSFPA